MTTEPRIAEALTAAHAAYEPHMGVSHDDGLHDALMAALPHLLAGLAEDEAVVERMEKAISERFKGGYDNHWCAEWMREDGVCEVCWDIAREALRAAAGEETDR